jgi:hypothetical protein
VRPTTQTCTNKDRARAKIVGSQALIYGEIPMSAMLLVLFAALWSGLLDVYRAMIGI